jgi:hypothetical protein
VYWVHWTPGLLPFTHRSTLHASREDAKREVFKRSPEAVFEHHDEADPHRSRFWSRGRLQDGEDDCGVIEDGAIVRHGLRANIDYHTYRRDVIALRQPREPIYAYSRASLDEMFSRLEDGAIRDHLLDRDECRRAWSKHRSRLLEEICGQRGGYWVDPGVMCNG